MSTINAANVAAETLQDCGSIASINQHRWGTEKTDSKTTAEVKQAKNASGRAGKYKINLANGFERELQTLTRPISRAYNYYLRAGIPWKEGERMLANTQLIDFLQEMQVHKTALDKAKAELLPKLPDLINKAVQLNGDLGKHSDYPSPQEIVDAYGFDFDFEPVPLADAFGTLPEGFKEKFEDNYNQKLADRMQAGLEAQLTQALELIQSIGRVLSADKPKYFQSTFDKLAQINGTLISMNLNGDSDLHVITTGIGQVTRYSTAQLKSNESAKAAVRQSVDALLAGLSAMLDGVDTPEPTPNPVTPAPAEPEQTEAAPLPDSQEGIAEMTDQLLGDIMPELTQPEQEPVSTVETPAEDTNDDDDDIDKDIADLFDF